MLNHRVEEFEQARFEHAEAMQETQAKHHQELMDAKRVHREELEEVHATLSVAKMEANKESQLLFRQGLSWCCQATTQLHKTETQLQSKEQALATTEVIRFVGVL